MFALKGKTLEIRSHCLADPFGLLRLPALALAAKESVLLLVIRVLHRLVTLRRAKLLLLAVKHLVAPQQEINLRIVQRRVVLLVARAVQSAQSPREIRPALPRELAMEHEYVAPVGVELDLGNGIGQVIEHDLLDEIYVVDVHRPLDVARLVLVRITAIDDVVGANAIGELAA